jgi:PIN domain nuclease of toxin-antitoxin system
LVEKNRLPAAAYEDLKKALNNPNHVLQEAPLTAGVVEALRQVPRDVVPDMPDRIVAATALYLGVPVISRDARIRAAKLQTVW